MSTISRPTARDFAEIQRGYHENASQSFSLTADAYTRDPWYVIDQQEIIGKTWQWVCHVEKVREPGSYHCADIAGQPVAVVRDREGQLRAFYNVCKHRAHHLLQGSGTAARITCPYHAWTYKLDGGLLRAPHTENLEGFNTVDICLDQVPVEEFHGFVYVNLNPEATQKTPYVTSLLQDHPHPVVATSDYMKSLSDGLREFIPGTYKVLGTDGFGRSDTREKLRDFFEIDRRYVVITALNALQEQGTIDSGVVREAIAKYGIDQTKTDPLTS